MTWLSVFPLHQSLLMQSLSLSPANSVLEGSFVFSTKHIDENTSARLAAAEAGSAGAQQSPWDIACGVRTAAASRLASLEEELKQSCLVQSDELCVFIIVIASWSPSRVWCPDSPSLPRAVHLPARSTYLQEACWM